MDPSMLPIECWNLIADKLSSHDLSLVIRASKLFSTVFGPYLYRCIDLSVHEIPSSATEQDEGPLSPCPPNLLDRQHAFTRSVLHYKPEYALWVRSFTWTMCLQRTHALDPAPEQELDSVIQLFSKMDRVLSVDIDGGDFHCYPPKPIPPLFPAACHIRLSGQMHYGLASAILHGPEKMSLKSLTICNLHELGHTRSGQNYQKPPIRSFYQWGLAAWDESDAEPIEEDWAAESLPKQVPPGPMRRVLNKQLASRCSSLESLTLCQVSMEMLQTYGLLPPGWYYPGPELHEEWATFIQAVRPCHLRIQYDDVSTAIRSGLKAMWRKNTCRGSLPYHREFTRKLLPLLKEGWPELRRLELTYWLIAEMEMLNLVVRDETVALLARDKEVELSLAPWTYYHRGFGTFDWEERNEYLPQQTI
ncbi:uncharacterized protein N7496_000017 [Penicillium cataractarum]|uniref:F-box domain-containing protein n=1 Tax=Penicillium cataractarum TaxID=2100454 RepID=A0A9W9VTN6_9EURO|nr:uncharacterized protein N7496_000017 [Penicillium cataractarum]KAJ5388949.1 hypothetical protein N7496_000017 [Penicillium cataractarum]